ncbi:MAG: type II toxin-antitoxin system PemK/MazF family toxin [Verrucomicrobiaceae bacterium]|nr:type II toxin-antitoxin system PemK/MazF family toxin [Verrucomicrobiaceae bacterium]
MAAYVPRQGDLIALDFDPQSGHEQKGRRPAIVISKDAFNKATGMAMCCPITNTDRRVPFHVPVAGRTSLTGFVMCEQVKSLDFRARGLRLIERAPQDLLEDVLAIIDASIF